MTCVLGCGILVGGADEGVDKGLDCVDELCIVTTLHPKHVIMFIMARRCIDRGQDGGVDDGEVGILGMKLPIPLTSLTSSARLRGASVEPLKVDMVYDM